jgi:hypothetical protein
MFSYNCWTKHEEKGVIIEDNKNEEDDDMYHEYGDTAMGKAVDKKTGKLKMKRHQMSLLMIFIEPSVMHIKK